MIKRLPTFLILFTFPIIGFMVMVFILLPDDDARRPETDTAGGIQPIFTPAPLITTRVPTLYPTVENVAVIDASAPDLSITDLAGDSLNLSDYEGQIVVVNFWATWCEPCVREMPLLESFAGEQVGVTVLAVTNPLDGQTLADIEQFIADYDLENMDFGLDKDGMLAIRFNAFAKPMTFIIDAAGIVRARHIGELTRQDLDIYLAQVSG